MLRHYFRITLRTLERQKLLAFINVIGLSIGIACFTLFLLYAVNEFSYDSFHKDSANIYRVYNWWEKHPEGESESGITMGFEPASTTPLGPAMKNDLADVEDFVRVQGGSSHLTRINNTIQEVKLLFADPQLFSVFTFPAVAGNPVVALQEPYSIALSRKKALQLFGDLDVLGKTLEIKTGDRYESFTIAAVIEDAPVNSTIQYEAVGSFEYIMNTSMGKESNDNWNMTIGISVYVKLKPGSALPSDRARLAAFRQPYFKEEAEELKKSGQWNGKDPYPNGYGLQNITDVHMNVQVDPWSSVNPRNVWILIGISGSVLLIACINFIILAIGRSAGRLKEVGVRKVIGSRRKQLIQQFLSESFLLTFVSALLGLGMAQTLLPLFNDLAGRSLRFSVELYPQLAILLISTIVIVSFLSGSYPALVLSGFKPVDALKNKIRIAGSNFFTRSLVTLQFGLSVALIISTVVILQQLSFMRSKDLGFRRENVVMISADEADSRKIYSQFRELVSSNKNVIAVSAAAIGLGAGEGQMGRAYMINDQMSGIIEYPIDEFFLEVMRMKILAGRNFDPSITSDTVNSVIINESLANVISPGNISKVLGMELMNARNKSITKTIIGVTKDFHFEDLTHNVRPQLFVMSGRYAPSRFFVRVKPGDPKEAIALFEKTWKRLAPELPFSYSFVDEKFNAFYREEQRWGSIVGWAGNICIFLACLGLFGLASLSAVNRTKEIGIRKVLGASVTSIVRLLCLDFTRLVILAILLAVPLAWYAMGKWLEHFAYKVELKWWVFVMTGGVALLVAVVTVASRAIKAGLVNPVRSLRSE